MPTTPANESCPSDVGARQPDRVPAHAGYASGREDRHVFLYAFDLIEAAVRHTNVRAAKAEPIFSRAMPATTPSCLMSGRPTATPSPTSPAMARR
jgi:hypothetical protein